jgi:hypothetical protein
MPPTGCVALFDVNEKRLLCSTKAIRLKQSQFYCIPILKGYLVVRSKRYPKRRKSLPAQPIYEKRCRALVWLISQIFTFSVNRKTEPRVFAVKRSRFGSVMIADTSSTALKSNPGASECHREGGRRSGLHRAAVIAMDNHRAPCSSSLFLR